MNNDSINRQDAIDVVESITSSMSVCINTDECHGMKRMQRQAVLELANLPSAQPEIIKCEDCMHNGSFDTDCPIDWAGKEYCSFAERLEE